MHLEELLEIKKQERDRQEQKKTRIRCCTAAGCLSSGAAAVKSNLETAVSAAGLDDSVEVCGVGCLRFCGRGTLVEVDPNGILYEEVSPDQASGIISALSEENKDREELPLQGDRNHPFFALQMPVVLENSGKLESDPHRILEGMAIAGYAIGANYGYIYVRAEYPLAIQRLEKAIQQAKKYELLGSQIFDFPFDFKIDIRVGAGAFVCGEETALIASIKGKRGNPRPRPPYPAESGLWNCPTLINNVETFANIVPIIREGSDWYSSIGTETSKGTKVFALTGKISNTGLIEVPMGTTVRQIVEEMGGGVPDGGKVKAVQTGGPSGGCIPAEFFDTSVDYESLMKLGTMMGSGGAIVMDEDTNMVEIARFYMEFCRGESCGKCVPCRAGTVQLHALLSKLLNKQATRADLEQLEALSYMVKETSLCGLGQSAPNPVLSTLRYFQQEYLDLIQQTS
jgi:bidirectional [NiFe] hydrogenase diaphorase subunit